MGIWAEKRLFIPAISFSAQHGESVREEGSYGRERREKVKGDGASEKTGGSDGGRKSEEDMKDRWNKVGGKREVAGNYKSGDSDGGSTVKGKGRESERERGDERGHGLAEDYNSRWALYAAALQRSDVFL